MFSLGLEESLGGSLAGSEYGRDGRRAEATGTPLEPDGRGPLVRGGGGDGGW